MKALFYIRANHEDQPGGDLVQLHKTAEALCAKGVKVEYSSDPKVDLDRYDLVHIFNSPRFSETKAFLENALSQNRPTALSTIYWSKQELAVGIAKNPAVVLMRRVLGIAVTKYIWGAVKNLQARVSGGSNKVIEGWLFENADILLPNSEGEMQELLKNYPSATKNYKAVRNAIDGTAFAKNPSGTRKSYVLSVGRVERRKNTLMLIEACHNLSLDLVLIGAADSADDYTAKCLKKAIAYGFKHITNVSQDKLVPYYYEAEVHAMVSWYETPGLASMEAACAGCKIVTTDRGSTKEYFKDMAEYCDPFSLKSIERSLTAAFTRNYTSELRDLILEQYTWGKTAEDTMAAYKELLDS